MSKTFRTHRSPPADRSAAAAPCAD